MDDKIREGVAGVVDVLEQVAREIRELESEARDALYNRNDKATYRRKMEAKAVLLIDLHERTEEAVSALKGDLRRELQKGIENFAHRGEKALETASLFYMYALLYPEDYIEGEPNDLERYISDLRQRYLEE